MRILLAKNRALGDTVFLHSTVDNLVQSFPGAEIHVLVPGPFSSVMSGNPGIRQVLSYDQGFWALVSAVRALRLDHFVQLHSSPSQKWLGRLSGAKRVSFSVQNNETEKAYGKHPNALEWDAFFLRGLLGSKLQVPGPTPRIPLSAEELAEGKALWRRQGADSSRLVFLGLGASRHTKRWPALHFAKLAELLRDRAGLQVAIVTGPGEAEERFSAEVIDQMRALGLRSIGAKGTGDFVHVAGLGVRELARALSAVRAYVGNDSGPKHLAAAVGVPTFTFFGPEDPGEWHPYSLERHPVFFVSALKCRAEDHGRWCGLEVCTQERHRCMTELQPLEALLEVKKVLGL